MTNFQENFAIKKNFYFLTFFLTAVKYFTRCFLFSRASPIKNLLPHTLMFRIFYVFLEIYRFHEFFYYVFTKFIDFTNFFITFSQNFMKFHNFTNFLFSNFFLTAVKYFTRCFLFIRAPHKKFASAHPDVYDL